MLSQVIDVADVIVPDVFDVIDVSVVGVIYEADVFDVDNFTRACFILIKNEYKLWDGGLKTERRLVNSPCY